MRGDPGRAQTQPVRSGGDGDGERGDVGVGQQELQDGHQRFAPLAALLAPAGEPPRQRPAGVAVGAAGRADLPLQPPLALALAQVVPARFA